MEVCKRTLNKIKREYEGKNLDIMLAAFDKYPTFKADCKLTRSFKERARLARYEKLLNATP